LCLVFNRGLLDYNQMYRCHFYFLLFAVIIVNYWLWVQCQTDHLISTYQKLHWFEHIFLWFLNIKWGGGGLK
jgi:hypothetical protein